MNAPFLHNCLLFTRALRRLGVPVGQAQVLEFLAALEWINIGNRTEFYHTARALLINSYTHLRLFDALFARFWRTPSPIEQRRQQRMPRAPRHRPPEQPFTVVTYMAYKARQTDQQIDIVDKSGTASSLELLQRKEFSQLSPEELTHVQRTLAQLRWNVPMRTTRRRQLHPRGRQVALRHVLRDAARHNGIPARLAYQQRTVKPRPLVIIADISGSMEKYSRLLLQLTHSAHQTLDRVESFVFATRLTRITPQLALRNINQALDHAAREVIDWSGGTRIGACLAQFNRRWARRVLGRGAVVLLISDGWEQGDPTQLRAAMAQLQRRCHRLIWLNPLLGQTSYQPRVGGMQAALRYVDDFLPIHNLHSLEVLRQHLLRLRAR